MQGALLHACKGCSGGLSSCHRRDDGHLVCQSKPAQVLAIYHIDLFTCNHMEPRFGLLYLHAPHAPVFTCLGMAVEITCCLHSSACAC